MEKPISLIDDLNRAFSTFWENHDLNLIRNQIFYNEQALNLNDANLKQKDNLILVFPNVSGNSRRSIGSTYNLGTQILFVLRVHTNKNAGNTEHQKVIADLLKFFAVANPTNGFKTGDTLITGGAILPEIPEWIISNLSAEYEAREQTSLT